MGYNSGLIILHDALGDIRDNATEFTHSVLAAIADSGINLREGKAVDIRAGMHVNAASLFHVAHADVHIPYLVGGNTAQKLPALLNIRNYLSPEECALQTLQQLADAAGYRLVKKSKQD